MGAREEKRWWLMAMAMRTSLLTSTYRTTKPTGTLSNRQQYVDPIIQFFAFYVAIIVSQTNTAAII
jgi:hypothetical protein